MGLSCCYSSSRNNNDIENLKGKTQQRSCISRMLVCFSEKYFIAKLTGKDYREEDIEEEIRSKLKFKRLSFYDYNEEKNGLLEISPFGFDYNSLDCDKDYIKGKAEMETENSEVSSMSSYQSVDEGAISVLSMEQIRNMRLMQLTSKLPQDDCLGMELESNSDSDDEE